MRRHGDPYDFPDIPGPSGLCEEYTESLVTPAIREAIAKREAVLAARGVADADSDRATPASAPTAIS